MNKLLMPKQNLIANHITEDTRYSYEILSDRYLDQVVNEFTHAFCRAEPMTHYLAMNEDKYKKFAYAVTQKAIEDECSIIALDKGKVIALALIEDLMDPGELPEFDPKFKYILALLEKISNHFFEGKEIAKNHIAHLFITAVDKAYRHQGLSTQVNFLAMDLAANKGFDLMYCEFTHHFNEKGTIPHLKNAKRLIGSQVYQEFVMEDEKPFLHLEGGANSYLWQIKEEGKLKYKKNGELIIETL